MSIEKVRSWLDQYGMADRILVLKDFQVAKEFARSPDLKETDIIEYMI